MKSTRLLQNLFLYCGGDPSALRSIKAAAAGHQKQVPVLVKRLTRVANQIDSLNEFLLDLDIEMFNMPDTANLRKYAASLQRISGAILKPIASGRVSNRDQHLAFLHAAIRKASGRPHFKEMAILVDAVSRGYGQESTTVHEAEDIRKLIARTEFIDLAGELREIRLKTASKRAPKKAAPPKKLQA